MASVVTLRDGPVLTFSVTPSDLEIAEGATATVTASVDPVHDAAFTATVAGMSDDDARWEFVGGTTLTFEASQAAATGSVTIRAIGNAVDDGDLAITLTGTSSVTEVAPPAPVVLTVLDDDLPQVSIAAPTDAQNTGHVFEHEAADTTDANWVWVLTRVGLTVEPLTVNLSVDDTGTFTDGAAATATFGAGESNVRYTPVANDTADEGHGTVTVTVAPVADLYAVVPGSASAMAAVRDDDGPLLEVSIDAAVTALEGMAAVFGAKAENSDGTLTLAGDLARLFSGLTAVTVNAQSADGSAMAASDYTAFDGSVALDAFEVTALGGRWSGNVSVRTTEDTNDGEGREDFTVTLSLPATTDARIALKSDGETGTATIVEGPALTLSVAPEELAEGATATVTASVEPTHDAAFTVTVAGTPVDTARWEFVGSATTLTFAANQAAPTGTVTIRAISNDDDDGDVSITLTGAPSVAAVAAPADVVLTVLDDDLPTVSIAAPTGAVDGFLYEAEAATDESRYRWSLMRDGLTDGELSVDVSVAETGGGDFVADGTDIVMFDAGESTVFYTPITDDTVDEAHGTVTVTVDAGSGYALGTASSAEVDVRDDDGTLLTVSLEPSSLTVSEGAAARFEVVAATVFDDTFTAPGDLDRVFSVQNLPVLVSSTDGTAMSDDGDYEKKDTTTTVAFADFSASGTGSARGLRGRFATDSFEAYADAVEDADETFDVGIRFSGAVDGRIALDADNSSSVATIVEGPSVTLTLSDDDLEEGDTATVTATVDPVHDMAFTVTLAAESNADRIAFPDGTTFNFAASAASASASLTVEAVDNEIDDGDAEVEIEATVSDAAVTEPPALELTVRDDDDPTVSIAAPAGAMDDFLYEFEAATDEAQYQWSLTRVGLTDEELIVDVSVAETGGGDFAADGTDTVTFAVDESTVFYTPITDDTVDEAHGTVTVTVDAGSGYALGTASSAEVDVRDDDGELVTVTLDPATPTVNEGRPAQLHAAAVTEAGTFDTAAHMARLFGTVTQAEAIASTEASTGTGAATAGTDYTALAATTVALPFADFAAGDRDGVLRLRVALPAIATAEDEVTDPGETFEVKLAAPAGQDARIAVSTTAATVTINEGAIRLCSGIAASTCTDINEALATRNTEGRVEVFNDGEWGTVCDDYWSNGDGNVACTQMGYPGAERVFWSSHFGGAVKGTRTWLDNLQCAGDEDDLFDCPRLGGPAVGDHNCNGGGRHVEDAGVRCLAANTAAMGAPTITGTAQVGETLTAATTGITDANGLTSPTYTYQWIRANGTEADIASANSSTYILVAADLGKTIKVEVSFEDDDSNEETLTSAATATVVAAPTAPMVSTVVVTSMPASGDTYGTGEMIRYTVTFDQAVTVVGAPEFEFCLGSSGAGSCEVGMPPPTRRRAPLSSGSGTTMLVFSYTVVEGDMDDNGIWAGDQDRTIKLEGGTIQGTVGGLDAVLTHTVVGTEADHKVNGAAANTAPTAANNTVTTGVGAAYTFEADDFGFADTDTGAALASVKIVTVPAAGALALDGTAVLANAVVTKAQIDGGMLTFTPVAGASGTGYASFTFKVNDGTDDSVSAYTMTIDVAASPTVSIAAPAGATDGFLYEFEAATEDLQYQWSLTRVGLTDEELIVDVSVAETGGGDFAADGTDTVTFAAGESAAAYTPITDDDLDEEHGTVTVTVDSGTGYAVDPDAASAEVDVRDDDGELVTVKLDPATLTVKEGRQAQLHAEAVTQAGTFDTAAHMARLFGTVTQAEAIASTEASTGTGAATAGTDYTALAAETVALPFADFAAGSGGVLRSRVALPGIATEEDEVTDPGETFEVKLAAPAVQDARIAVSTTAATVTINEGPPGGAIRLCSGTAASTCTDVSEALATRNTQGRVEVINDGVWGTVCDDYWSNDDGQVACTQMGFAGAERVFWNSHFGGAAKGTRTWLDNLRCAGHEVDLFDCPRSGGPAVGDHNCNGGGRHVEDAGVRCLAAESAAHGAKVDPLTLTIAPGRTGRYWVSLTKDPEADVLVYPKLNTEAMAAPEVTEGPLRFPKDQWSYALDVDVTVNAGTALGTYTVTHTMDLHNNDVVSDVTELTFTVPAVTVTVAASTSVSGPAPVSATVSGRDASVRFDAPLDASFAPSAADFAVLADGRRLAVTGAWTAGRALLLELAEPATGAVRLAYVPSAAAPLGGRDGSAVAPFEALALAAPGELADDAPDALTADAEPKLEGAPGLEAALADALRHAPGPVAATLAAPRRAVKDLTGLGALPELRRVNLAGNAVTDAGPLALLGDLERLDLSDNAVQDLWPLSGLAELRVLNLSGNRVTDVTALAGLPRLRVLELSDNAVVDLWPLGALPALEYLGLSGNRVTDVTALADLHALTRLDLGGNAVADAAPLGDVGRLVWLKLSGNRLATLDGLGRLTKLRWVWVADNPLPDGATVAWPERAWVDVAADGR